MLKNKKYLIGILALIFFLSLGSCAAVKDKTKPIITILGDNPMTIYKGQEFKDPGATAVDDRDGEVDIKTTGSVDINKVSDYKINYEAYDKAGNKAKEIRIVKVVENDEARAYPPASKFTSIPTNTNIAYPDYLKSVIDPVFKTKITRISDATNHFVNHNYPKTQTWNLEQTMMRLNNSVVDAKTLEEIAYIDGQIHEIKWSSTNTNVLFGIKHLYKDDNNGANVNDDFIFYRMTLEGNNLKYDELIRFSKNDYQKVLMGPYEGNIDYFDHYLAFSAQKIGENYLTAIVYDISNNTTTIKDFPDIRWRGENDEQILDWISVSPLGKYVLINWRDAPNAESGARDTMDQYDIKLNYIRELSTQASHGDIGVAANNQEIYVQFEYGSRRGIWGYNLETGTATRLLPDKYNGGHISCRNYQRYGWCYPSTTAEGYREVFALKLDDSETVERFAQTRQSSQNSFGGTSPDGTKIIFRSNWNGQTNNRAYESFIVEMDK